MISFELSAIDVILSIAVVVLLILYLKKFSLTTLGKKSFPQSVVTNTEDKSYSKPEKEDDSECPRGFGRIKNLSDDNSVSERCLGCYQIMECYSEVE
ncbi:hypothetical protein AC477_01140 [miscellaneous Crenarchaeota group-1 archaeon SG8-32-1]|uniref:Uncharacterized protein n=1 Tax=miscellaneous Crenarchaeota group-1 archaeon SG8-32-1 TaxID=1685124 RepID=A0A0M0BYV0_9ARCH|nr:MAG: hypothetical protein AC477_01140 [miscellaneous Crenarchaeota group-1 archaeon SG8-32-1]